MPIYERTADEVRRPFAETLGARLELLEERIEPVENPYVAAFRTDGDRAALARDFTAFFRAFSEPSLKAGLAATGPALEELYRRLESRIENAAAAFDFEVNALTALIARR